MFTCIKSFNNFPVLWNLKSKLLFVAFLTNIFWCLPTPQPHLMLASLMSTKCQPHWPLRLLQPPPSLASRPLHTPFLLLEMLLCGSLQGYFFSSFGSLGYPVRKAFHNHASEVPLLFSITAFCSCNYQFVYFLGQYQSFPVVPQRLSFNTIPMRFVQVAVDISLLLLLLTNIPLYEYPKSWFSIVLLMSLGWFPGFGIRLVWTFLSKYFYAHMCLFLLDKHLEVELLSHRVDVYLNF